uniref:G-rich RNA sequence binding factor 1 n=1 Tax=Maylandia zebra TaxID=106582 RepID=A0A3P9CZA5_9CICH|nr:G-rich sequence factor 1 [Maylandia zebra]
MSCSGKSLWFLLRRCVAVRQLTVPTASRMCGFTQQRTLTSAARTACFQRLCELQPAVRSSQSRFCTKTGGTYEDDYPPLPAYHPESKPESREVYIVQVKGLPWSCTTQDLLQFFSECRIRDGVKGIHLTLDRLGRPSGRAFIEMEHEEDVSKALEKHRQYLGPRYVEVYEVTNGDAEVILKKATQPLGADGVVLLRGLPFTCTEDDIVHFFSGLEIMANGITMVTDSRGRKSGVAYVQFTSQEAADEALQRDREIIGSRYIEVFPSRRDEIHSTWRKRTSPFPSQSRPQSVDRRSAPENRSPASPPPSLHLQSSTVPLHYIHVRGLPFQASGEDIVKFFCPLAVCKILIECGPDGRPSGEADVYFHCHRDAVAAMSKDRMNIGERYIELFLNSVADGDGR